MNAGFFETMLESIPLRAYVRETMEVKRLRAMTGVGEIEHGLHIACGNGDATRLILKHFPTTTMTAVDRNAESIAAAQKRHRDASIAFSAQEATALDFEDCTFDAVFDLAELHNLADWKKALNELHRVLRRGGLLIAEELSKETFAYAAGKLFKSLTEHPYDAMFGMDELKRQLVSLGFEIVNYEEMVPFGLLKYYLLIARKL